MINAWVLYFDFKLDQFYFKELTGSSFESKEPKDWGLDENTTIVLVLQKAQFLSAWVQGRMVKPS